MWKENTKKTNEENINSFLIIGRRKGKTSVDLVQSLFSPFSPHL